MAEWANLAALVSELSRWGDSVAVVEHRGIRSYRTTYAQLHSLNRRFAAELQQRGIQKGDRVVLWCENSAAWIAAFYGCVSAGVLVVPLDAAGGIAFAERVIADVRPSLIAGDAMLLRELAGGDVPGVSLQNAASWTDAPLEPLPTLDESTPLQILFTSGTTGEPKGVVHTHGNLLASVAPIAREIEKYRRYERWVHPLRMLHTLPLSHVFGQFLGLWIAPVLGATVHYEKRTVASRLLDLIPRERVHVLIAVPRTLGLLRRQLLLQESQLANQLKRAQGEAVHRRWWRFRRLHRQLGWRFWAALCGGATLPADLERFWTTIGVALIQGYGLTETAALVTLNHPFRVTHGSVGAPLPGRELRLGPNGELQVKGAMVSSASWQRGSLVERSDPWLDTGDLAEFDEAGRVRFVGRSGQRLVTAAGLNVYLADVEQALTNEPGIVEALVFGLHIDDAGDIPAAVVVGAAGAARAAVERANAGLLPHQRVKQWWIWPGLSLPRTSTGKILRRDVEGWARASHENADIKHKTEDEPVLALLRSVGATSNDLSDAARLDEDWRLDSMGRVALAAALEEQIGIAISESAFANIVTLGDLRGLVAHAQSGMRQTIERTGQEQALHEEIELNIETQATLDEHARRSMGGSYRYPAWPWQFPARLVRTVFQAVVERPLVDLIGSPKIEHVASPEQAGPLLIIANHVTAMDVPLVLYALPRKLRGRIAVMMAGEMLRGWEQSWLPRERQNSLEEHRWWGPLAAPLLRLLFNVFPLPRASGFRSSFAHAGCALDEGMSVLLFPEGRRIRDAALGTFRPGLGLLVQEAEVPVLSVAIKGLKGKRGRWFRPNGLTVRVGKPMQFERGVDPEAITQQLQQEMEKLLRDQASEL